MLKPGDEVTFNPDEHYIYELIGDEGEVFYVGRTNAPQNRLCQHWRGCGNKLVTKKLKEQKVARMRIVAGPVGKGQIDALEREHIAKPGRILLNQEHRPEIWGGVGGNRRLPIFQQFATQRVNRPGC